jgi:hypothetical protein
MSIKIERKQLSGTFVLQEIHFIKSAIFKDVFADIIMCFFWECRLTCRLILFPGDDSVFSSMCLYHIESLLQDTIEDRQNIVHNDVARLVCHW